MVALLVGLAGLVTVWVWALCIAAARAEPAHGDTAAAPRKPRVALVERAALQERDTVGGVP